eukprot:150924-Pleurochrysis_carterae.AAC.1
MAASPSSAAMESAVQPEALVSLSSTGLSVSSSLCTRSAHLPAAAIISAVTLRTCGFLRSDATTLGGERHCGGATAVGVGHVRVGARLDEQRAHVRVASLDGQVERGDAVGGAAGGRHGRVEQLGDERGVVEACRLAHDRAGAALLHQHH